MGQRKVLFVDERQALVVKGWQDGLLHDMIRQGR